MRFLNPKCTSTNRLEGKTAVVTGSNTGIGKETARDFYRRGARVIMACRSLEKSKNAADEIINKHRGESNLGQIVTVQLDLSSLRSVRNCAQELINGEKRIDLLVNNAGILAGPKSLTEDGFESHFGTNHLGPFLFTLLLIPKICQSRPARIVNVSALAHAWGRIDFDDLYYDRRQYHPWEAYKQSKIANILFTKELARRIESANISGLTVYTLHPGVVHTELTRNLDSTVFRGVSWLWHNVGSWFIKSPEQGAQTTIYCAVDDKTTNDNGLYYEDCEAVRPAAQARNGEDAENLWKISLKLVELPEGYDPFNNL